MKIIKSTRDRSKETIDFSLRNREAMMYILLASHLLDKYLSEKKESILSEKSFLVEYADDAASHLLSFINFYLKNLEAYQVHNFLSYDDLLFIGETISEYCKDRSYRNGILTSKCFLNSVKSDKSKLDQIYEITECIIKRLNAMGVNTCIYKSVISNSIYIKPDSGVLRTIRVSDHEQSQEFKNYYSVILSSENKIVNNGEQILFYVGSKYKPVVTDLISMVLQEKQEKQNKMTPSVYNKNVYKSKGYIGCFRCVNSLNNYK